MFTLKITLGNEAMQTGSDVARALRKLAARIADVEGEDSGGIIDDNGNKVGSWTFTPAEEG